MNKLDDLKLISGLDSLGMLGLISDLAGQCRDAGRIIDRTSLPKITKNINNIVFSGLGGSAIGADITRVYLRNELKLPLAVCRNYSLPDFVGEDTLLFCLSYSGNTEEVISCFNDGLKRGALIITAGSGGKLEECSARKGFRHIKIPSGIPPRIAIGYMAVTVISALAGLGFISDKEKEFNDIYSILTDLRDNEIGMDVEFEKNIAKKIAYGIYGKYPVIYGTSDTTEAVAVRWRGQLAENSKTLSSSHIFPEVTHNEIVGWEFPKGLLKDFSVIILRDKNDHPGTKRRMDISKTIIERSGAKIFEVERKEGTFLSRLFSLINIGDFVSFYLAILNNVDPTPVKNVEYLKKALTSPADELRRPL